MAVEVGDGVWFRLDEIEGLAMIEWVEKSDPMVGRLLQNRSDVFQDYDWHVFRSAVERRYRISDTATLQGGRRTLLAIERHAGH